MSAIWNDIELTWNGESYTVRPTMEYINYLEQGEGRSLAKLFTRLVNHDLPSSVACELIAKSLTWAGAKGVTTDDVYAATSGGINADAITMASAILVGVMPKASGAPAKKKPVASTPRTTRKR